MCSTHDGGYALFIARYSTLELLCPPPLHRRAHRVRSEILLNLIHHSPHILFRSQRDTAMPHAFTRRTPFAVPCACGMYTIHVMDVKNNCGIEKQPVSVIGFPQYFTPNNDGIHDTWQVIGISKTIQPSTKIKIFNRYGGIIYDVKDYKNNWSGQAIKQSLGTADKLPNGTYYYVIILRNSGLDPITGPLFLGTK